MTCTHARYAAGEIQTILYGSDSHSIEKANAHRTDRTDEKLPQTDLAKMAQVVTMTLADPLAAKQPV
jgi:hypothetical protein